MGLTMGAAKTRLAEIITLRAIALKHSTLHVFPAEYISRDHNATSYSTETLGEVDRMKLDFEQRS